MNMTKIQEHATDCMPLAAEVLQTANMKHVKTTASNPFCYGTDSVTESLEIGRGEDSVQLAQCATDTPRHDNEPHIEYHPTNTSLQVAG
jgi:hypothetical protein